MNTQDPSIYFNDDVDFCLRDLEERIQTTVRDNPHITAKSVLERAAKSLYVVTEEIKDQFTKALCNSIEKGIVIVDGFQGHKNEPFEAQLIAVDNNGQTFLNF